MKQGKSERIVGAKDNKINDKHSNLYNIHTFI